MECYSTVDINQLLALEKKLEDMQELLIKYKLKKY